ncbi:cytochrome P450 [Dendrothele bispora CBS 962.96]|uniref:Cytochrome P450 n=1 Tax=Dendrothele bispora (strain CBS 962.96) TaxID=1314807 RepID=A0A4S8LNW5_DENBC|nr:cytochrome P450 [Dendrothele bispora CBS 962.96]
MAMTSQQFLALNLSASVSIAFAASLFCYIAFNLIYRHVLGRWRNPLPYPPGPPSPSLLLGHYEKLPREKPWFDYMEMGKTYGELIYFRSLWDNILVINSAQATDEIMEKQARITSDRPFGNALDKLLSESPSSDKQGHGDELMKNISTLSQGIMMKSMYGLEVQSAADDAVPQAARETADHMDQALLPGGTAYRSIPFAHLWARLVPSGWSEFAKVQKCARETLNILREVPFEEAMKNWKSGDHSSLIGELMMRHETHTSLAKEVEAIKNMASTAVTAASDTTVSATATFFLALILYPGVQYKAQEELDRVLGPGRIPSFKDRKDLPFVEAVYREVMRWHPALPMSLPHKSTEDMIYNGYFIPKGTILHANLW